MRTVERLQRFPLFAPIAAGIAGVLAAGFAWAGKPGRSGWLPPCPLHAVTGLYCPGCGGTRALHALMHGNLGAAFHDNALTIGLLPVAVLLWIRWTIERKNGRVHSGSPAWLPAAALIVLVGFTATRNLSFAPFDWLAPLPA